MCARSCNTKIKLFSVSRTLTEIQTKILSPFDGNQSGVTPADALPQGAPPPRMLLLSPSPVDKVPTETKVSVGVTVSRVCSGIP